MGTHASEKASLLAENDLEQGVEQMNGTWKTSGRAVGLTLAAIGVVSLLGVASHAGVSPLASLGGPAMPGSSGLGRHHHRQHRHAVETAPWIASSGETSLPPADDSNLASMNPSQHSTTSSVQVPKMKIPVYIMGDGKIDTEDYGTRTRTVEYLVDQCKSYTGMSHDDIKEVVHVQDSIYPARWPETLDMAIDAVHAITTDTDDLEQIQWFAPVLEAKRRSSHACDFDFCTHLAHHIGCLLTHTIIWNRALDAGHHHFVVWETDAFKLNSVSPLDYNNLADHTPEDADLIWIKPDSEDSGQFMKRFKSNAAGTWPSDSALPTVYNNQNYVYLYKFNKRCAWAGSPSYMMTKRGAEKIIKHIQETKEVDMIDAWLSQNCMRRCSDPKRCMNLNCYVAQTNPIPKEVMGGYVPEWYDDAHGPDVQEVDPSIVEELDHDHDKYNKLACNRHGSTFGGWAPTGVPSESGKVKEITDCVLRPWTDHHMNFCDKHFPADWNEISMLGMGGAALGHHESHNIAMQRLLERDSAALAKERAAEGAGAN